MNYFKVLDVSDWPARAEEPAGDDEKEWLTGADDSGWLYKPRT